MALRKIQSGLVSNLANISFNSGTIFSNLSVVGTITCGTVSATVVAAPILSAGLYNSVYTTYNQNSGAYVTNNYNGNLTIQGSLSVLGDISYVDTIVTVTSALSVLNVGTGPAFTVNQTGAQPIARFLDDGATAVIIADGGNLGIGLSTPTERLTIVGNISSSGNIVSDTINCNSITGVNINGNTITGSLFVSGGRTIDRVIQDYADVPTVYTTFHGVSNRFLSYTSTNPFSADWNLFTHQSATLYLSARNAFLKNPTNQVAGGTYLLFVRTLSGNANLFFDSLYRFPDSAPPTVSQGASAVDIFSFISDGQYLYGSGVQNFSWA